MAKRPGDLYDFNTTQSADQRAFLFLLHQVRHQAEAHDGYYGVNAETLKAFCDYAEGIVRKAQEQADTDVVRVTVQ